jgi:hypothetical protein
MPLTRTRMARVVALTLVPLCLLVGPSGLAPAGADAGDVHVNTYGREVWPGDKSTSILVDNFGATEPATVTITTAGKVRRTMTIQPACFFDACTTGGPYDGYSIEWDGLGNGGGMQAPGTYHGSLAFIDNSDQPHEVSLGSLFVAHLETVNIFLYPAPLAKPDSSLASVSTIGRCSSVAGGATESRWTLRLLSLSRCDSRAGTDDWAFAAQRLTAYNDRGQRLISVRLGAEGSPVNGGDLATIVLDTSFGHSSAPTWKRVAVISREGGQYGAEYRVPPGAVAHAPYPFLIQGRVTDGNRFRVRRWHAVVKYRAWNV